MKLRKLAQAAEARLQAMPEDKRGPAANILVSHPRNPGQLVRLCEHNELKPHSLGFYEREVLTVDGEIVIGSEEAICPGGVFLPDDTRIFTAEFVKTWRFCPRCGRPNFDQPRMVGIDYCSPSNCDIWVHTATFNHATRQWDALSVREAE